MGLEVGKLRPEELSRVLSQISLPNDVLVPPGIGLDAAVVKLTDKLALVIASDPITATTQRIGYYAVHVNANDIASVGGDPKWMTVDLLLPESADERLLDEIMSDLTETLRDIGASLVGGHTEVTPGIDRPIIGATMVGTAKVDELMPASNARADDLVVLTKWAGLEGTSIAANEKEKYLRERIGEEALREAKSLIKYISVLPEAREARKLVPLGIVHASHDPTEGGILGGIYELADASGLGFELWADEVPLLPVTSMICQALDLDPLKLISSGALLISISEEGVDLLVSSLKRIGVHSKVIGRLLPDPSKHYVVRSGKHFEIEYPKKDEIWKLFEGN